MTADLRPQEDTAEPHPTQDLDDVVHQRVRLGIMAVLEEARKADFNYLAAALDLTHGNLSRHLRVLEDAGLIKMDKRIEDRRTRSWLSLTARGRRALHAELDALRAILDRIQAP
jgi:DNA-binding MarR family transcriptional regulator